MTNEKFLLVKPLLEDVAFGEELIKLESIEDIKKLFEDKGVALSVEEIEDLFAEIGKATSDGEIDEAALENVSGGAITLASIALYGAACAVTYGVSWAAGRYLRNKSGVCRY